MPDEDKLAQDAARAARAQALLSNELLTEAFEALEQAYIAEWRASSLRDDVGRERLYLAINIVGKVREHLELMVSDGKVAADKLRDLAQTAERNQRLVEV